MPSTPSPIRYKFHLLNSIGASTTTPTVESLFYNWSVIHTSLMLGTAATLHFSRYAQNYVNPDVPAEARILPAHPSTRFYTLADHWAESIEELERAITDPSHEQRMGRHVFGDPKKAKVFVGRGGCVYVAEGFKHPAELTVAHWIVARDGMVGAELVPVLEEHKRLVVEKLEEFAQPVKYTVDVCDDEVKPQIECSALGALPVREYAVVEWLHFANVADGFEFVERFGAQLKKSYAAFADLEKSHSLYGVERVVLDFTDEDPSTKTPLPKYFTDKTSAEYKIMHGDWNVPSKSFELLNNTKWSHCQTSTDREKQPKAPLFSRETFEH